MFPKELVQICVLYALTPVHAGAGQAIGAVDLPIQRERHTQWPQVQASGVKGAFRDWFLRYYLTSGAACEDLEQQAEKLTERIFGKEEGSETDKGGQAGAISFTDARLLAFPVRANVAPFVWVICPALLSRLGRDLRLCQFEQSQDLAIPCSLPTPKQDGAYAILGSFPTRVILEDLAVEVEKNAPEESEKIKQAYQLLAPQVERLLLISDQNFAFLVQNATEIQPQIRIDFATGTTATGSLRYQELLPADTVLYTLVFYAPERIPGETALLPEVIQSCVNQAISRHMQMGGDLTLGRGLMEVKWFPAKESSGSLSGNKES